MTLARDQNNNRILVPQAQEAIEQFKYEIADEIGIPVRARAAAGAGAPLGENHRNQLDAYKYEVAEQIGLRDDIERRGWANMTSRECGRVGGRMGGRIGGQMVRRMIQLAEQELSR